MNPFKINTEPFGNVDITMIRKKINGMTDEEIIELLEETSDDYKEIVYNHKYSLQDAIHFTITDYTRMKRIANALHKEVVKGVIHDGHTFTCRIKRHAIQAGYSIRHAECLAHCRHGLRSIDHLNTPLTFDNFAIQDEETFHLRLEKLKIDVFSTLIFIIALEQNHYQKQRKGKES